MLRSLAVVTPVLTALVLAATAQAAPADRYAAPAGVGAAPCAEAAPCSLGGALTAAKSGDTVLLAAGTYTVGAPTTVPDGAHVRPGPGAGRPTLNVAAGGQLRVSGGSVVSGLELVKNSTGSGLHLSYGAIGERLVVRGAPSSGQVIGVEMYANTILRDSLVAVHGPGAQAVQSSGNGNTYTTTLRNDTLIATGDQAVAANLSPVGAGTETHHIVNTILSGTGNDLVANAPNADGSVLVDTHASNYTTVKSTGPGTKTITAQAKQSTEPQFVSAPADATTGDYHQLAGSPTVNAGTSGDAYVAFAGTADLDGDARTVGASVDIGADEFVPPALPQPPTPADPGTGDPAPADPAPADPAPADPGTQPGPSDPLPGGETPGTGDPQPGGTTPKPVAAALATVKTVRVTLQGRVVALKLACPQGASACGGTVSLNAGKAKLGAAKVKIAAGRTATVRVPLSKKAAKTVARYGRKGHRVDAVVTAGTRTKAAKVLLRGR